MTEMSRTVELDSLRYCSECGAEFDPPVTAETALEFFSEVEYASFHCERCADEFEQRGSA